MIRCTRRAARLEHLEHGPPGRRGWAWSSLCHLSLLRPSVMDRLSQRRACKPAAQPPSPRHPARCPSPNDTASLSTPLQAPSPPARTPSLDSFQLAFSQPHTPGGSSPCLCKNQQQGASPTRALRAAARFLTPFPLGAIHSAIQMLKGKVALITGSSSGIGLQVGALLTWPSPESCLPHSAAPRSRRKPLHALHWGGRSAPRSAVRLLAHSMPAAIDPRARGPACAADAQDAVGGGS